jgi:hypothetical protein
LTFGFGGPGGLLIAVSLAELVGYPYLSDDGTTYQIDGEDVCNVGILSSQDNEPNANNPGRYVPALGGCGV